MRNPVPRLKHLPDARGYFGDFGGRFVPETLLAPLEELEAAFRKFRRDSAFRRELDGHLKNFAGRPTPLMFART
jgi:tryptophan synthase beta chain